MTTRRRTTVAIAGILGVAAVGFAVFKGIGSIGGGRPEAATASATTLSEASPLSDFAAELRLGKAPALAALAKKLDVKVDGRTPAIPVDEAQGWVDVFASIRVGYLKFQGSTGRAAAIAASSRILDKFAVEPAPVGWLELLTPMRDIVNAALVDPAPEVRATALGALGKCWNWTPGRSMMLAEEKTLAAWKDCFRDPAIRQLADRNPVIRCAAVACLAQSPIEIMAAPAAAYIDDAQSADVRYQVLNAFAQRATLLTEDMIIRRLHDGDPRIVQLAQIVLHARGLSRDQVALGKMITSPSPELRASVIPLLKQHDDLDPVVWLLRLSHDPDTVVRRSTVEALGVQHGAGVLNRLREIAATDPEPSVRTVARRFLGDSGDPTASLPPLPGSASLGPRAN